MTLYCADVTRHSLLYKLQFFYIYLLLMSVFLYTGLNWRIGDIVWAKLSSRPWWPAVVVADRSGAYRDDENIHLLFIDTAPTTAWVNSMYVFLIFVFCNLPVSHQI